MDAGIGLAVTFFASTIVAVVAVMLAVGNAVKSGAELSSEQLMTSLTTSGTLLAASVLATWTGFVGAPVVASRWRGQKSLAKDFGLYITWSDLWIGVCAAAVMVAAELGISGVAEAAGIDLKDADNGAFLAKLSPTWTVVMVLCVTIGAPIVEELYFRGLTLRSFQKLTHKTKHPKLLAAVATSAIFAVLHYSTSGANLAPSGGTFVLLFTVFMFGLVLAWLALKTGRLGAGIVAHICVNTVGAAMVLA